MLCIPVPTVTRDICNMMCLAGGSGMEQATAEADDAMPPEGLPVARKRAGARW
jgi:hypothetical protein